MAERSIAERLFLEADQARHQELIDFALDLIRDHEDHAPRIDTGEWTIEAQERIDDLRNLLNLIVDPPLRQVCIVHPTLEHRKYAVHLQPFTGPFPWAAPANHGNQGD
ncbi:hypothetical protein [Rhizobium sp. SSA_523]|uniref:hypothetical protein n=1 Tax=Rhizobium sp. SSA_523 TaxID=2952477 RepID=UPI00209180DE|nr:hypothetical protein [Rhizobium sp. SSA_523]MCO5730113.1 hypothetical protein [Rhizobium sp. SSA_523]WKC25178.1 hypothetical protein QTJ18_14415 [Rhizobium sp. SSA_523]